MSSFRIVLGLKNTDPRWYRDKYLVVGSIFFFVVGMSLLWQWPLPHREAVHGLAFLGLTALCVFVSPQRLFVLGSALVVVALRGVIGAVLYRSPGAAILAAISGGLIYALSRRKGVRFSPNYEIKDYSYGELVIDLAVLILALFLYIKLSSELGL